MIRPSAALLRPIARQVAARRFASTTAGGIEHHSPSDPIPAPPRGVAPDPQLVGQDYPQLPEVSLQTRSPYGWWDRQERKNFNEIVLEEEDRLGMWGPDIHKTTPFSALMQLSLALSLVGGFAYILSVTRPESPVAKRDYPYNGLEKELGGHGGARAEQPVLDDE